LQAFETAGLAIVTRPASSDLATVAEPLCLSVTIPSLSNSNIKKSRNQEIKIPCAKGKRKRVSSTETPPELSLTTITQDFQGKRGGESWAGRFVT
jgi:hypothetical protein